MTDTSALENLKYAHACDVALDITSQEVHELWADIEAMKKRLAYLESWRLEALADDSGSYDSLIPEGA